jgi:hypothetical protein
MLAGPFAVETRQFLHHPDGSFGEATNGIAIKVMQLLLF